MPTPRSSHAPGLLPAARPGRTLRHGAAALLLGWLLLNWPLPAAATAQRLAAIEAQLRGKPKEAAAALGALAAQQPAGSPLQAQTLLTRGLQLVHTGDATAVAQAAAELAGAAKAPAFADVLRATWLARHGALGAAERLLADALPRIPADTAPELQLQLTSTQAGVQESLGRLGDAVRLRQVAIRLAEALGPDWRRAEQHNNLAYTLHLAQQPADAWPPASVPWRWPPPTTSCCAWPIWLITICSTATTARRCGCPKKPCPWPALCTTPAPNRWPWPTPAWR